MKYRNLKNGVIIDVQSVIGGKDWTRVDQETKQEMEEQPEKQVEEPEKTFVEAKVKQPEIVPRAKGDDIDGITVKEIKQELDANGITYTKTAKKQELYDLMMGK